MHGIASQEHAALVIEVLADSLADLVRRPPVAVFVCQLIRCNNLLRSGENSIGCDLRPIRSTTGVGLDLRELDVEPGKLVLTWNDHHRS